MVYARCWKHIVEVLLTLLFICLAKRALLFLIDLDHCTRRCRGELIILVTWLEHIDIVCSHSLSKFFRSYKDSLKLHWLPSNTFAKIRFPRDSGYLRVCSTSSIFLRVWPETAQKSAYYWFSWLTLMIPGSYRLGQTWHIHSPWRAQGIFSHLS